MIIQVSSKKLWLATLLSAFAVVASAQSANPALDNVLRDQVLQQLRSGGSINDLFGQPMQGGAQSPVISNTNTMGAEPASTPTPTAENKPATPPTEKPLTQFQKFVLEATGKLLPVFGQSALRDKDGSSSNNMPVSTDYLVAPGDELFVRAWGGVNIDYRAVVDRNGSISIPRVGSIPVAGVKARDLDEVVGKQIGVYFKNFSVATTIGRISGLKIYVTGQAMNPGVQQLPSSATLATAALSVAQPGMNGSFRSVQLKRGGKVVGEFDLYALLRDGTLQNDMKLQSGDVVHINQVGARVALNVDSPLAAIFEVKPNETLADVVAISGIDSTLLRQDSLLIEGFQPDKPQAPRVTEQLSYTRGLHSPLKDGDVVTLFAVRQEFANAVTLKGNVAYPARYPYLPGMRISDLIPNNDALIPPSYYEKRNALVRNQLAARQQAQEVGSAQSLLTAKTSALQKQAKMADGMNKESTASGDNLAQSKVADQAQPTVEETVKNLLPQVNWEYAVIERLDKTELQPKLYPFNLRKAMGKDPQHNVELLPGDVVTVFSAEDASIPKSRKVTLVKVAGEVGSPGFYQINPGESIRDVLVKAGGITPNAYLYGARLMRKSIQEQQREQLLKALDQAERQLQSSESANSASALNAGDAATARSVAASQKAYLEKLRNVVPDGRIVMEVGPRARSIADLPPIELEDGDSIVVPPLPGQVAVFGSVYSQGAFAYQSGESIYDYLNKAGGATKSSDKGSVFVIRANGKVDSAQQGWIPFVSGLVGVNAQPGDTIYVPEDYERVSIMKGLLDFSTVFYQLGLGVAAIDALRD